ncbi:putative Acetyl-CoA hydrolase/transferase [Desulforapulum autotrophicum HRM2]|uniref:Acetyl-CoA hydrolase/transferase n=1 Tax=Desulforapulum autotrophicum (strain ATCC 43914 / DSM 3382 / VKM B-1955 / HRM2) TaxID=177437 RepID=C0QFR0_DESAH|nr:acetyl-CoA hydrolase/transferase [Desulforapulum autotrophicum]ACN15478.1 putative Acetyl-CoA hydrolase/transferase [Desulforapulum autotrophicum HRM2]
MGHSSPIIEQYQRKLVSAEKAARIVKPGDWVDYGAFCAAPRTLDKALADRVDELENVNIRAVAFPGKAAVALAGRTNKKLIYNNWHFSSGC